MSRTLTRAPDPHQAPPVAIATRRDLFGSMGALLLLSAAEAGSAKAAELDGELIAMCEEAMAIDRESDRLWDICCAMPDGATGTEPAFVAYGAHEEATLPHLQDLMRAVIQAPSRTPEGLRAKAALACKAMPRERVEDGAPCDRLALSLYSDMLGRAGA